MISNDLGDEMALGESTWGELTWGQIDMGTKCVRIRSDSDSNLLALDRISFCFCRIGSDLFFSCITSNYSNIFTN